MANLNSFILDYAARQKIGGQNLNFFVVEQFPTLSPFRYDEIFHGIPLRDFISSRVLKLCYTAWDLKGFAEEMGYDGPPFQWNDSGVSGRFRLQTRPRPANGKSSAVR